MRTIAARRALVSVIIVTLLAAAAPTALAMDHVQFGANRLPPLEQQAAFTNDPAPELGQEFLGPDTNYLLGASGEGTHVVEQCAEATGGSHVISWVSNPMFLPGNFTEREPQITIVENVSIRMDLRAGDVFGIEPLAAGPVSFSMGVSWIRPEASGSHGPHADWTGGQTLTPEVLPVDLPIPPDTLPALGVLPSELFFYLTFEDDASAFEAGSQLWLALTVECDQFADFGLEFGPVGPFKYVWGSPTWDDTDGDRVPDQYDSHPDGTMWSKAEQDLYQTDWTDAGDTPDNPSEDCDGFTLKEAKDENPNYVRGNPDSCPATAGFPLLLLLIVLLLVILLVGGAFGAVTAMNRKILMEVSHDGFQDIPQGSAAVYLLSLTAKGNEGEEIPAELSLKGVPEDWSAAVEPSNLLLIAGEEVEPVTATLTVTPPAEEEFEAEAVVTVTATPTDADGKTSPMRPGTSVKTKTIVNIDQAPPEGTKRKKRGYAPPGETLAGAAPETEEAAEEKEAEAEEEPAEGKKKVRGLGFLKRGKKADAEPPADADEVVPAAAATAEGKPDLAVGKMNHEPADFSEGDKVTTTVPVRNKGDAPVEGLMLRLYVNDERVDEKEVNLEPGATAEVSFTWTAQPDENRVRVRGGLKEA